MVLKIDNWLFATLFTHDNKFGQYFRSFFAKKNTFKLLNFLHQLKYQMFLSCIEMRLNKKWQALGSLKYNHIYCDINDTFCKRFYLLKLKLIFLKPRIQETPNLLTDASSSTDIFVFPLASKKGLIAFSFAQKNKNYPPPHPLSLSSKGLFSRKKPFPH